MRTPLMLARFASRSPYLSGSARCRCVSKLTGPSSIDDPVSNAGLRDKILKAPFDRVGGQPLFPWRHSEELLDRLVPGTDDYFTKGHMIGAGLTSSNPRADAFATAFFFMNVPWSSFLFFKQWKRDLAEDISWAFAQGVGAILSNTYRVSFDSVTDGDNNLKFDHSLANNKENGDDNTPDGSEESAFVASDELEFMIEQKLRSLYESASQCGKDQIQVRLECKPTGQAHIFHLFVFPFLSRRALKREPELKSKYEQLLMSGSAAAAMPLYMDLIRDYHGGGHADSTVICQVLVECDEIFWVKDKSTGVTIQGHNDEKFRKVWHLVRMEMVVETHPSNGLIIPFEHRPGNWMITDIDDLLDGNLII